MITCHTGLGNLSTGLWQGASWANPTGATTVPRRRGTKPDSKTSPEVEEPHLRAEDWEQCGGVWLKTVPLTTSWSQSQTRCGSGKAIVKCQLGPRSLQDSTEPGFASKLTQWLLVGFSSSRTVGPRALVPSWLFCFLTRDRFSLVFSNMAAGFTKVIKWERTGESQWEAVTAFYHLISEVTPHHLCCILLVGSKSPGPAHTRGEGSPQEWEYQEAGITGNHFRRLPTTRVWKKTRCMWEVTIRQWMPSQIMVKGIHTHKNGWDN